MIYELRYRQTEIIEFLKKNTQKILKKTLKNGSIYVGKHLQTCFGQRFSGIHKYILKKLQ